MKIIIQFVQLVINQLSDYQLIELVITSVIIIEVIGVIIMLRKIIRECKLLKIN